MEGEVPTPSLWLDSVAQEEQRDRTVEKKNTQREYAVAVCAEGTLLVARADDDGVVDVYSVGSSPNADAATSGAPSTEFANSSCRLVIRYSLGVGAFGAPGEGKIWVGSKAVCRPFGQLSFVPGKEHELVFFQQGSKKLLSVRLPPLEAAGLEGCGVPLLKSSSLHSNESLAISDCTPVCSLGNCPECVSCLAVSRDSGAVAAVDEGGTIRVWSLIDGQVKLEVSGASWAPPTAGKPLITSLAFVGNSLLSGACWDGAVRIWGCHCPPHLRLVDSLTTLERSPLVGLAVHWWDLFESGGDGSGNAVVAAGAANGLLHVWASLPGRGWQLAFVADHAEREGPLAHLAFSKCGTLLATAAEHRLAVANGDAPGLEGHECSSGDAEENAPIRVYETARWACLAAHRSQTAKPIAIRFVDRRLVLSGERRRSWQGDGSGHTDMGQVLLMLSTCGPPHIIRNPETTAAKIQPRKVPPLPGALRSGPGPSSAKQVSFRVDVSEDDQRELSQGGAGLQGDDGGQEEGRGEGVRPGIGHAGPLGELGDSEQNELGACSGSGSRGQVFEATPLDVHSGGDDVEGEEEGEPTPLPLPAHLVKSKEQAQPKGQRPRNPPLSHFSRQHSLDVTVPPATAVPLCQLSAPALHSTARLLVQLDQLQEQRFDSQAALQSVAAGSRPSSVRMELAGLTGGLSLGDFARLGGQTQGGVPRYEGLTALEEEGTPQVVPRAVVAKQVGSQGQTGQPQPLPHEIDALWHPQRSCPQVCDIKPTYWAPRKDAEQNDEICMATWSCLAAIPR